jgi:hypothetical protein
LKEESSDKSDILRLPIYWTTQSYCIYGQYLLNCAGFERIIMEVVSRKGFQKGLHDTAVYPGDFSNEEEHWGGGVWSNSSVDSTLLTLSQKH